MWGMKYPNLELIEYIMAKYLQENCKDVKPVDFEAFVFPQTWGSTALGFGGVGGSMMTAAYTTVMIADCGKAAGVFFQNGLAYVIIDPNEEFFKDLTNHKMVSKARAGKYKK